MMFRKNLIKLSIFIISIFLFSIYCEAVSNKGLEKPISVEEQELLTPERTGFVAVEWGGTEIK